MNDALEAMLYANVARDLKQRFGARAFEVADEARASLAELGDEDGQAIWIHIADALGRIDCGQTSALVH
jgi:hypothetical protein